MNELPQTPVVPAQPAPAPTPTPAPSGTSYTAGVVVGAIIVAAIVFLLVRKGLRGR